MTGKIIIKITDEKNFLDVDVQESEFVPILKAQLRKFYTFSDLDL
jgi:hypothetical protein